MANVTNTTGIRNNLCNVTFSFSNVLPAQQSKQSLNKVWNNTIDCVPWYTTTYFKGLLQDIS